MSVEAELLARGEDEGAAADFGHRRHVAHVERIILGRGLRDHGRRGDEEQRAAVGRGAGQFAIGRLEGAARLVLDIDIGAKARRQPLRDQPRGDVGAAAGRQPDDDADGLAGKILRFGALLIAEHQCSRDQRGRRRRSPCIVLRPRAPAAFRLAGRSRPIGRQ